MLRRPTESDMTSTLFPYTTPFSAARPAPVPPGVGAVHPRPQPRAARPPAHGIACPAGRQPPEADLGNRRNGAASRGAAEPDRPRRARRAVDPPAGAAVPQVSRRHADALLPDPAAAAGPPAAGAEDRKSTRLNYSH